MVGLDYNEKNMDRLDGEARKGDVKKVGKMKNVKEPLGLSDRK